MSDPSISLSREEINELGSRTWGSGDTDAIRFCGAERGRMWVRDALKAVRSACNSMYRWTITG